MRKPATERSVGTEPILVAGRYRLEEKLAEGGVGTVHRALDMSTGDAVALKQLLPSASRDARLAALFQREYHTLSQLKHPRVIEVFDYGIDAAGPYYTMELLDGTDLGELAPIPYRKACHYLRDVASCLSLLHTRRLLHRDLSPRNVRCTGDDRCKLLDFGTMATFGVAAEIVGTPPLVAPECLRGVALDHRADLYSLGALAYRLLTRRYAYRARQLEDLPQLWQRRPNPPSTLVSNIPAALDDLVLSLLSLDPMLRPATAAEVIDRLTSIAELEPETDVGEAARSYLVSATLVGRDSVMERLHKRVRRTLRGRGSTVVIEGNPGVGKSRLLDEVALAGQLAGALTVRVEVRDNRGINAVASALSRGLWTAAPTDAGEAAGPDRPVIDALTRATEDRSQLDSQVLSTLDTNRVHAAMLGWLGRLALRRPLLLLFDDIHRADEASALLLAALAHEATYRPMLLLATRRLAGATLAPRALKMIEEQASSLRIHRLRREHTIELSRALFGNVPNVDALAQWIHGVTTGSPMQAMALFQHLVEQGIIRYVAGIWVIPTEFSTLELPNSLAATMLARIAALQVDAREVAEALSVQRGPITLALCLALSRERGEAEIFPILDDLVRHGVLVNSGDAYAFSQEALRETLLSSMEEPERRASHRRVGEALLAQANLDVDDRIDAGYHIFLGGDRQRGADLIAGAAPELNPRGGKLEAALPALEAALSEYAGSGRPVREVLRLQTALVMSSVRDTCERHGEATLAELSVHAGLPAIRTLQRWLAGRIALAGGVTFAWLRRFFTHKRKRGPRPPAAIALLFRCIYGLLPVRASATDLRGLTKLLDIALPLRTVPGIGEVTYRLLEGAVAALCSEHTRAERLLSEAVHTFSTQAVAPELSTEAHRGILAGAYIALGLTRAINDIHSEGPLEAIEALESLGRDPRFAKPDSGIGPEGGLTAVEILRAAHQIQLIFHLVRGEAEVANVHRDRFRAEGVQSGMYWQFDLMRTLSEALSAISALDLVGLRRATEQLKQLQATGEGDEAVLAYTIETGEATMFLARNRPQDALATLENAPAPVGGVLGWDTRAVMQVTALRLAGRADAAKQLAQEALAEVERVHGSHQRAGLALGCAMTLVELDLGHTDAASARVEAMAELLKDADHPLILSAFHEAAAKTAWALGQTESMLQHLQHGMHWASITHNPAVISRAQKWGLSLRQAAAGTNAHAQAEADEEAERRLHSGVSNLMAGCRTSAERARRALHLLLEEAAADTGLLYELDEQSEINVTASVGEPSPPDALEQRIRDSIEAHQGDASDRPHSAPLAPAETSVLEVDSQRADTTPRWTLLLLWDRRGTRSRIVGAVAFAGAEVTPVKNAYLEAVAGHLASDPTTAPIRT